MNPISFKEPRLVSNKAKVEKVLSIQEISQVLQKQKMLSGRMFEPEMKTKQGISYLVDVW